MNVVIVSDFATANGGAAKVAMDSARAIVAHGVPVTFVHATGDRSAELDAPGIETVGLALDEVWSLPAPRAALQGIWNATAARRLAGLIAASPPDTVVHVHQWTKAFSPSVFAVCRESGLPTVLTLHEYFAVCPNGAFYRFDTDSPCTLKPLSTACIATPCDTRSYGHKLVRVARQVAVRHVLGTFAIDAIHVSDRGLERAAPHLPDRTRHHRVDNPIDVMKADPVAWNDGRRTVYYVGRLTREKGADLLAHAARRTGVACAFIGEGPLADDIRAIAPSATVIGWRPHDEVIALLRHDAMAVAAPSRWWETGPLTIGEARSIGLPAIVSSRAGAGEPLRDGIDGLIVEPTAESLATALCRLNESDTARRMGATAHARFWAKPQTLERHAADTIAVYQSALKHRGGAIP